MIVHSIPTKRRGHPRGRDGFRRDSAGKSLLRRLTLTGVEELYITLDDVQLPREIFLRLVSLFGNTRGIPVLKFSSDIKLHGSDRLSGYSFWPVGSFCVRMRKPPFFCRNPQDYRYVFIVHPICSPPQSWTNALGPPAGGRGDVVARGAELGVGRCNNNGRPATRGALRGTD